MAKGIRGCYRGFEGISGCFQWNFRVFKRFSARFNGVKGVFLGFSEALKGVPDSCQKATQQTPVKSFNFSENR